MKPIAHRVVLAGLVAVVLVLGAWFQPWARAQRPITLRIQSSVPVASAFYAKGIPLFKEAVEKMSAGRLRIEPLPAGAIVPAFEVHDAVSRGVLDGGHTYIGYLVGKHPAAALLVGPVGGPFGFDPWDLFAWYYEGGGLELYQEFYRDVIKLNVVGFPLAPVSPQVLGWYKRPIARFEDFKGLKIRVGGIVAEVYREAGAAVVTLPGGEIVPAAERGVIEGAEWAGPAEDMPMGFHQVWKHYHMDSVHEPSVLGEIVFNRSTFEKLPPDLQEILRVASQATVARFWAWYNVQNARSLRTLKNDHKVNIYRTPEELHVKILEHWDRVAARYSQSHPFFKKVYDSQREFARLVVPARRVIHPEYRVIADYYWKDELGGLVTKP
ncbi:MAG TPA: TRAP transporter substrate-binding protein [Candidatus Binatia bacterium]|nr:TRAP transporter substrate-binding protein [Candidatus Binatia bacterium]